MPLSFGVTWAMSVGWFQVTQRSAYAKRVECGSLLPLSETQPAAGVALCSCLGLVGKSAA